MIAAPTATAKIAVCEVRDLGELDIYVLEQGRVPGRGTATGSVQARPTVLGVEPRPFYPERTCLARQPRGARAA
jgi:hypothetical protein